MANAQGSILGIIAEARDKYTVHECNQCAWRKCCSRGFGSEECGKFRESIFLKLGIEDGYFTQLLDRLEAAHKREIDVLKQRCAELNAEVAAKDEVIKRLNDAISEEQRRKMATTENPSAVGDAAKLREAVIKTQSVIAKCMDILNKIPECGYNGLIDDVADELCDLREEYVKAALAAPPRNCDKYNTTQSATRKWAEMAGASIYAEGDGNDWRKFFHWLYAEAKEGGSK